MYISKEMIDCYKISLTEEEKAPHTIEKYVRDVQNFQKWLGNKELTKQTVLEYKQQLCLQYKPSSVNSVISSLNSFFTFNNYHFAKVKTLKIQRQIFAHESKELSKSEYERLLIAAKTKKNERLYLIMQTICSSGIRVSELKYITVEAVKKQYAEVNLKGKLRHVILPKKLCKILEHFIRKNKLSSGNIFITRSGKPVDRSNIWSDMKKLCSDAKVSKDKVFPHNLRHLFARTYYSLQKDIVRLADILGHSSINTTRIYTMESCDIHRQHLQKLGLILC